MIWETRKNIINELKLNIIKLENLDKNIKRLILYLLVIYNQILLLAYFLNFFIN